MSQDIQTKLAQFLEPDDQQTLLHLLHHAGINAQDPGIPKTIEGSWGQHGFTFLRIPLYNMSSPKSRDHIAEEVGIRLFHCAPYEAMQGILTDRRFRTKSWEQGGAGHHAVYGVAYICHDDQANWERQEMARCMWKASKLGKNVSNMIVEATAVGTLHTIKSGGIDAEAKMVSPSVMVHYGHRWCAHPTVTLIEALWIVGPVAKPARASQGNAPSWA